MLIPPEQSTAWYLKPDPDASLIHSFGYKLAADVGESWAMQKQLLAGRTDGRTRQQLLPTHRQPDLTGVRMQVI